MELAEIVTYLVGIVGAGVALGVTIIRTAIHKLSDSLMDADKRIGHIEVSVAAQAQRIASIERSMHEHAASTRDDLKDVKSMLAAKFSAYDEALREIYRGSNNRAGTQA